MEQVDAVVIGSGQGGVPLAVKLAAAGKRVVLFERERYGGSCINWGCTPTKAFLAAAHAAGRARNAATLGVRCDVHVDFTAVMERVRRIRDGFAQSTREQLLYAGVRLVDAEASFTPEGNVQGGGYTFAADTVVIDTGSSPAVAPIPGIDDIPYLTDRNFWNLTTCPRRTLVIGGGYVAVELGQGLARLGSEVHLILRGDRLMTGESAEVSAVLEEALARDGVRFHRGAQVAQARRKADDQFVLVLDGGQTLEGDAVLMAVGRRPNTEALNAAAARIMLDKRGHVVVSDTLETTRKGVYAIGEVAGQPAFTHVSWEDHRRLLATLHGSPRTRSDRILAYAVFTEPQVGRAGLSLEQAKAKGLRVREARMDVAGMKRAVEWNQESGFFQLLVETDSDRILGATLVGYEAAELVHALLDFMEAGGTASGLHALQHIHPTYAEYLPVLAGRLGPVM
ncbi:MAG: FAD-dependent oxidoreductase [Thiohalomonadaceae bacterium]